ncbi:hypothetical protein MMC34_008738 [Xylographa carneopallida]|nr:hypothetical protein [Xylographa carneopallida]
MRHTLSASGEASADPRLLRLLQPLKQIFRGRSASSTSSASAFASAIAAFSTAVADASTRSLLALLQPIRQCLHAFLSDADAVRLLRTSRATAAALLPGYAVVNRVFTFSTTAELKGALALYDRYDLRVLRMSLPQDWNEPLLDGATGRSLLPASLMALSLGKDFGRRKGTSAAYAALDGSECAQSGETTRDGEGDGEVDEFWSRFRPVDTTGQLHGTAWDVFQHGDVGGVFNLPLSPGALPRGLRMLQLSHDFNRPLEAGSIPDTVVSMQFGYSFDQPLAIGHLPASLTHLVLGCSFNQPLFGVLPAGLLRLRLGHRFNQPLSRGALPPQLRELSFSADFNQPLPAGVIPSSVTHLRFCGSFNQRLEARSIPHGVVHLQLGYSYSHPLPAGVLPSSLRELALFSQVSEQPLQRGSLPDGLEVLAYHIVSLFYNRPTSPALPLGIIPASVQLVSLGEHYEHELLAGTIPATVRWLRLPSMCEQQSASGALSPSTHLLWSDGADLTWG